jgi:two-component system CheB/CheR fusion protein
LGSIFDLFYQPPQSLDRAKGGLGLGLAIVRSLVELHGGHVSARSAGPGTGSEFIVELPEAAASVDDVVAVGGTALLGAPSVRPTVENGKRVLVVDDNEDAAETLGAVLEDLGHEVQTAHDGPAALRIATTFRPEICLLDIGLPAMDGYELARKLLDSKDLPHGARLIAVTGYGQDGDKQRSREAGFDDHLIKPVSFEALSQAVGTS